MRAVIRAFTDRHQLINAASYVSVQVILQLPWAQVYLFVVGSLFVKFPQESGPRKIWSFQFSHPKMLWTKMGSGFGHKLTWSRLSCPVSQSKARKHTHTHTVLAANFCLPDSPTLNDPHSVQAFLLLKDKLTQFLSLPQQKTTSLPERTSFLSVTYYPRPLCFQASRLHGTSQWGW